MATNKNTPAVFTVCEVAKILRIGKISAYQAIARAMFRASHRQAHTDSTRVGVGAQPISRSEIGDVTLQHCSGEL